MASITYTHEIKVKVIQTEDELTPLEKTVIEKAKNAIEKADLVLYVADSSSALDESDFEIMDYLKEKKAIMTIFILHQEKKL